MKPKNTALFPRLAAICAVLVILVSLATVAYAADIGGIRRSIQIWLHGDQTDAVLEIENGSYTMSYTDIHGQDHIQQGGGIAIEPNGSERPLTEAELLDQIVNKPEVEYHDDGTIWLYYNSQRLEITDLFDEAGICYVTITENTDTFYVTVKYQNGFAFSPHDYPSPDSFNTQPEK